MKSEEFLAKDFARYWTKPELPQESQDALAHAYLTGFRRAKFEAAGLMNSLNNSGAAVLIGALFTAEVDPETGKRLDDV